LCEGEVEYRKVTTKAKRISFEAPGSLPSLMDEDE
jgi:hypothetical protein